MEEVGVPSKKGRGRRPDWDVLGGASSPTPESEFLSRETRRLLGAAIDRLSAPRQLVLRLMTLEGFSCEATARMLCESVATVKSRLHRARKTLRAQLSAGFGEESHRDLGFLPHEQSPRPSVIEPGGPSGC